MRKSTAINMTLDGFLRSRTAIIPDGSFISIILNCWIMGVILYGRITPTMQSRQTLLKNPSGEKINGRLCNFNRRVQKLFFQEHLKTQAGTIAKLYNRNPEEILELKQAIRWDILSDAEFDNSAFKQ